MKTGGRIVKFWSVTTLAEFLGVPKTWIYDRTRVNGPEVIPHMKFGKYIRFAPESRPFQEWLEQHQISSTVQSSNPMWKGLGKITGSANRNQAVVGGTPAFPERKVLGGMVRDGSLPAKTD
jgi:hypothetical protein